MPSFDIVNKVNEQEVDNAFQQARKEIEQRYDFKGTDTHLEKKDKEKGIQIRSSTEQRLEAAREVLVQKLAKRGVSLRGVKYGTVEQSGKTMQQLLTFVQGIETEKAFLDVLKQGTGGRSLNKNVSCLMPPATRWRVSRVSGKSRDDLQQVMHLVRGKQDELGVDTQFENFRE